MKNSFASALLLGAATAKEAIASSADLTLPSFSDQVNNFDFSDPNESLFGGENF